MGMVQLSVRLFLVVIAIQAQSSYALYEWNCGLKYINYTVPYVREVNCYRLNPNILNLLEGSDEILNRTGVVSDAYVQQCAKAVIGRGYPVMVFTVDKCIGSEEINLYPSKPIAAFMHSRLGCYTGDPVAKGYYIDNTCKCGNNYGSGSAGKGAEKYSNVYRLAYHHVGLWIKTDDVFQRTSQMFNKSAPAYINLMNETSESVNEYLNQTKLCGIAYMLNISHSYIRPSEDVGFIQVLLNFTTSFPNMTHVFNELPKIEITNLNITNKSVELLKYSGGCGKFPYMNVAMQFGKHDVKVAPLFPRDFNHTLAFVIEPTCGKFSVVDYYMKIARISESGEISKLIPICNGTAVNVNISQLVNCTIEPFFLSSGIHYVMTKAWSVNNSVAWNYTYKYINVTKPPLTAAIEDDGSCLYTVGRPLIIHGWNSFDKDVYDTALDARPYKKDLIYMWTCHRSTEISSVTLTTARSMSVVENGVRTGSSGGCFNTGYGRLKSNTRSFQFKSDSIAAGYTLVFTLFVTKGFRTSKTTKKCKVVPSPPKHALRCLFNCGRLVKVTARLGLEPYCDDVDGCPAGLEHYWKLYKDTGDRIDIGFGRNETVWEKVTKYKRLTTRDNVYLVIAENTLEQNETYKIVHSVSNSVNGTFISNHIFTTNRLPHSGNCTTDRKVLQAAVDSVVVTCKDWVDVDQYLRYEAWAHSGDFPKLLYYANSSTFPLKLPLGDSNNNFTLKLEVKVFDYFESYNVFINLTVNPPKIADRGKTLLDMLDSDGNEQEMAQIGIASLSLIGTGNGTVNISASEKIKIRDKIIGSMVNVAPNGSRSINLVSGVLIESTANSGELSVEGQMQSVASAMSMSEALSGVNSTDDPAIFDSTGTTLLYLTGNIINGAAAKTYGDENEDGGDGSGSGDDEESKPANATELKNVAQTCINATNSISTTLLSKMLGGEKPKKFETPSLGLEIAKTEASKLPESYNVNGGGVNVPSFMKSLVANGTLCPPNATCAAADMFVSSKVTLSKNNPFTWGNSTVKVKSPVLSMEYSNSNGTGLSVDDLDTDFELKIPSKPPKKPSSVEYTYFVSPDKDCVNHKTFIDKNDTAFELIFPLSQEKYTSIFIRYGKRATKTEFDFEYYHPDFTSCVEPPERDSCTGIEDFMECMELPFNETTGNMNETAYFHSNNGTNSSYSNATDLCQNVTISDVSFLTNGSVPRYLPACVEYHDIASCPPCPDLVNGTNSTYEELKDYNASMELRPDCRNNSFDYVTNTSRPVVCPKVQRFLDCKNRTVEHYVKCQPLLTKKKLIYNQYAKCHKNIYRRFIGIDVFNVSGWYYIAVCFNSTQWPPPTTPPPTTTSPPTTAQNITNTTSPTDEGEWWADPTMNPTTKKHGHGHGHGKRSLDSIKSYDYEDFERVFDDGGEENSKNNGNEHLENGFFYTNDDARDILQRTRRAINATDNNAISNTTTITTKRKCAKVEEKPAPTIPPIPTEFPPARPQVFNGSASLNYSLVINTFTCVFWNETTEMWSTGGCRPHKNSSIYELVCLCNHLTSFGSDLVVAPNVIELDDVLAGFANLAETGNFSVLFTLIGLFLLYIVVVIFARRADRRHVLLVSKMRVGCINNKSGFNYEITVSTGTFGGSGTTANVAMVIHGDKSSSHVIPLADEDGSSEEILSRGNVVHIMVNTPEVIGDINYIHIWHNNKGTDPSWFMRQITIRDLATDKTWLFIHNDWFAVDKSDGRIDRPIYAASEKDKTQFKTLFYSHTAKSFSDKHLWISVILRPPSSTFTCVQRITCCFSLLFTAMLANAMFYQNGDSDADSIQIGPITISLKQIIIGIESGLIVAPVNLLIMTLFRKSRPKSADRKENEGRKAGKENKYKESEKRRKEKNEKEKKRDDKEIKVKKQQTKEKKENTKEETKKKEKKEGLPHWVVYIAYTLSLLSVLASATVVLFYSMMWGTDKSNGWMVSVSLSLFQDILVVQPLKVLVLAMLFSLVFPKPPDDAEELDKSTNEAKQQNGRTDQENETDYALKRQYIGSDFKPLKPEDVEMARTYQVKKNTVRASIKEIVLHLTFFLLLSTILFGSQSSHRYQIHKHLNDVFSSSESITDAKQLWAWCEKVLLPGLYQNQWYNGQNFIDEKEGFISDKRAVLISMPRLRQGRVKSESCEGTGSYPKLQKMFPVCYPYYDLSKVDESPPSTDNNPQGNVKLNDSVLSGAIGFERMCLQPFIVQSAEDLGTLPAVTNDGTYSGSGMVADLGYDYQTAKEVVFNLKEDRWITRQTRIIFIEFVVFEPASQLYAFARFTFEQQPTGAIIASHRIEPFALYGVGQSSLKSLLLLVELILIIFIIVLFIRLTLKFIKEKKQFFRDFWNVHMVFMLILSLVMMAMMFVRENYVRNLIKAIQENPYSRMSFDYVQYGTDVVNAVAAVVIFLATLKLLSLFRFNMKIQTFSLVLSISKTFLLSYALIFFVIFFAFAQMASFLFGHIIPMYSNLTRSFVNVFQMSLGSGLYFHELKDIDPILGPFYIFIYCLTTTLVIMNFFVAILNDSYVDGCDSVADDSNEDAIMADFMSSYIKSSLKDISKELKKVSSGKHRNTTTKLANSDSVNQSNIFGSEKQRTNRILSREAEYFLY